MSDVQSTSTSMSLSHGQRAWVHCIVRADQTPILTIHDRSASFLMTSLNGPCSADTPSPLTADDVRFARELLDEVAKYREEVERLYHEHHDHATPTHVVGAV